MEYAVVFCGYKGYDTKESLLLFERLSKYLNLRHIVVVANSVDAANSIGRAELLMGDNNLAEFGAYQSGLNSIKDDLLRSKYAGVFFANDTIWKKAFSEEYYWTFSKIVELSGYSNRPVIVGKTDSHGKLDINCGNYTIDRWISTHLFYMSAEMLLNISFNLLIGDEFQIENRPSAREDIDIESLFFAEIEERVADKLRKWLFGGGWHNSAPLNNENYIFFRKKLRCIINEYYISAVSQAHGKLISVNDMVRGLALIKENLIQCGFSELLTDKVLFLADNEPLEVRQSNFDKI